MKIVGYNQAHADQVLQLLKETLGDEFGFEIGDNYGEDIVDIDGHYLDDGGGFWVALEGDEVIGCMGFEKTSEDRGCMKRFYIKKNYRRKGVGLKLLEELVGFCKKNNIKEIYASTIAEMTGAANFYLKNGFERIDKMPEEMPRHIDTEFFQFNVL